MNPLDMLIFWASLVLAPAYICRLNLVRFGTHSSPVVLFHLALFLGVLSSGYHGYTGNVDMSDVAAVVAAGAWLAVSWHTWGDGAPLHSLCEHAAPLQWPVLSRGDDREGQR